MNDTIIEQEEFYTTIAKYYSEIFPYKPAQLEFIKKHVGDLKGKSILDIGCATGDLVKNMAEKGVRATGIDLNMDLLEQAEKNNQHPSARYLMVNMLHIGQEFDRSMYDVANCFGNTIVHLLDPKEIQQMLDAVYKKLKTGGTFFLQLLNYDYIINDKIEELPLIETDNLQFIRKYDFATDSPIVEFSTQLVLKKENKTLENKTSLLMLKREQLKSMLQRSGFKYITFYADFKGSKFGGKHLQLVVKAKKN